MPYYPLSQIQTNLFTTNDKEFVVKSTNNFYAGKYWGTSDGKFFTGTIIDKRGELYYQDSELVGYLLYNTRIVH